MLEKLEGVEKKWELNEGVSRAASFPTDAFFHMHRDRPYDTLLTDNLKNINMLIVGSGRLKEFLEKRRVEKVEYLPVTILDHKDKPIRSNYFIIHPIDPVACLDIDRCGATWDELDEDDIESVQRIVIDASMIDEERQVIKIERKLFRPRHFYRITLIRRDLAEAIDAEGFTGIRWVEMDDYPRPGSGDYTGEESIHET